MSTQPPDLTAALADIQGNILEGFSKDDPIIGQPSGDFDIPGNPPTRITGPAEFVTVRGGEYFIQPPVTGIRALLGSTPAQET